MLKLLDLYLAAYCFGLFTFRDIDSGDTIAIAGFDLAVVSAVKQYNEQTNELLLY